MSDQIRQAAAAAEAVYLPVHYRQDGADPMDPQGAPDPLDAQDGPPPLDPSEEAPLEAAAAEFELNDYGNGRRMVHYFGQDLHYVPRLGWFRWDGRRWVADEDAVAVRRDAQKIASRITLESAWVQIDEWQAENLEAWRLVRGDWRDLSTKDRKELTDQEKARLKELDLIRDLGQAAEKAQASKRSDHRAHAKQSGNSPKITNMMAEASVARGIGTTVDQLNANRHMVCTKSGVLHFTKILEVDPDASSHRGPVPLWGVELVPHTRDQMITKMMNVAYDPKATARDFGLFMRRVQPDPETRDFLQRYAGYSLLGDTTEHKLLFNYGVGRNGKSTLVDTLAYLFADYGTTIPIESLTGSEQRKGSEATPDLVRLPGARFVRASEPEQGTKMKEALIKALTGGEAILIRRMHAEFVEVQPEFKLWISGNHKPEIRGADDGIWKRVVLVPWEVQIPDDEIQKDLPARLRDEAPGILNWMVEGALKYLNSGMPIPAKIADATRDYRTSSDPMREFLLTECDVTGLPVDRVTAPYMRDAFNAWRLGQAEATWTANIVSRRIAERAGVVKSEAGASYTRRKSNGETLWEGIKLRPAAIKRLEDRQVEVDDINRRAR